MTEAPQQFEPVYRSGTERDCREYAMVLTAAGIEFHMHRLPDGFVLIVTAADAVRARAELNAYANENRVWSKPVVPVSHQRGSWGGVLGFAGVLILVAILEQRNAFGQDWVVVGMAEADAIRHGQWWRVVTALTLHVDLIHLAGNIVFGSLLGFYASQLLGGGFAWLSILTAGAAGNLLNAWIRPLEHKSMGASTAVFAALGMVAAYTWQRRRGNPARRLARWAPLVGGVILLSFLGTGGARTDVAAHVAGFAAGALCGALYGNLPEGRALGPKVQLLLGMATLTLIGMAWWIALTAHGGQAS